jgi:hypothetical protein
MNSFRRPVTLGPNWTWTLRAYITIFMGLVATFIYFAPLQALLCGGGTLITVLELWRGWKNQHRKAVPLLKWPRLIAVQLGTVRPVVIILTQIMVIAGVFAHFYL